MLAVREAIRELVAWGLVTNDTVEALREIARWKPMIPRTGADPTSWLPADYKPGGRLPLILSVHGGPAGAWDVSFRGINHVYTGLGWAVPMG